MNPNTVLTCYLLIASSVCNNNICIYVECHSTFLFIYFCLMGFCLYKGVLGPGGEKKKKKRKKLGLG